MESREGGSWFLLVVERADKKNLILDADELSAIQASKVTSIASQMFEEGMRPVVSQSGGWESIELNECVRPGVVPPSIRDLAKYIPSGTVITLDNGCLPSIEWRFGESGVEVFHTDDYFSDAVDEAADD